jgi:hypothetical protein
MTTLQWHDQDVINGIQVKAFFFDGDAADKETNNYVRRVLPMLADAPVQPKLLYTEQDRKNLFFGQWVAQADSVLTHGAGLLSVEYKSGGRDTTRKNWRTKIKLDDMLQGVIASYVVAQTHQKVTACLLRYYNVVYLLTPGENLLNLLGSLTPDAMKYWQDSRRVSASQLATFAAARVRAAFPNAETAAQAAGRVAHEAMLKRDGE